MSVSLMLHHRSRNEVREVPIATEHGFREGWLPVCQRLGLHLVPMFSGGALTPVPANLLPAIIDELTLMRSALNSDRDRGWIVEQIDAILAAFWETSPDEWDYTIG